MFEFLRRHRHDPAGDEATRNAARDTGPQRHESRASSGAESWRAKAHRDRDQRQDEPSYGGAGYFGNSDSGGQSFNGAQRVYPGDPGYRAHPTHPVNSARIGAARHAGPKNYQRADDLIRDEICERLTLHDGVDVSEVSVEVAAGVVTLSGMVEDRYEKHLIEDIADDVFGVQDVENRIRVQRRDDPQDRRDVGVDDRAASGQSASTEPSERTLNLS